ncbi:MAG TPA: hypothetical protein VFK10_04115 [Burkholderiaceae bacterium]|nr:hypothetical protein [Burkholderiaceae bacterium]
MHGVWHHGWTMAIAMALALAAVAVRAADAEPPSDKARREQINAERAAAQARYEQAIAECERGFVVTSCVNQAKAERRAALDRLSREQMALDDAQRKRRAEQRRQQIAEKRAQQAQEAAAARDAASSPAPQVRTPRQPAAPASGAKAARRAEPHSSDAAAATAAEATERASDAQERRERAQAHEEAVRKRNAERAAQRPPAAPLPLPDAASGPANGARAVPPASTPSRGAAGQIAPPAASATPLR